MKYTTNLNYFYIFQTIITIINKVIVLTLIYYLINKEITESLI